MATKTTKTTKANKTDKTTKSKSKCAVTCKCNNSAELKSVKEALEQVFGKLTHSQCCEESEAETPRKKSISDLKLVTAQDNDFGDDKSLIAFLLGGLMTSIESAVNPEIPEEKVCIDVVSLMAAIHGIYLHGVRDGYMRHQVKSFEALLATDSAKILFKELGNGTGDAEDYNEEIDEKTAKSLVKLLGFVHPVIKDEHLKDGTKDSEYTDDTEDDEEVNETEDDTESSTTSITTYQVKITDAGSGNVIEVTASSQDELIAKINKLKENGDIPTVVAEKVITDVIKSDEDDEDDEGNEDVEDVEDDDDTEDNVEDNPTNQSSQSKKFTKPVKPVKPTKSTKSTKSTKACKDLAAEDTTDELINVLKKIFSEKE